MPSLNFRDQFAPKIKSGEKRQTIRAKRKRPIVVGDSLYLFTGMQSKQCERIGTVVCRAVSDVEVGDDYIAAGGAVLSASDADEFAVADGFEDRHAMIDFFKVTYGLPFSGDLIAWGGR
jgi:hypothetical protein